MRKCGRVDILQLNRNLRYYENHRCYNQCSEETIACIFSPWLEIYVCNRCSHNPIRVKNRAKNSLNNRSIRFAVFKRYKPGLGHFAIRLTCRLIKLIIAII